MFPSSSLNVRNTARARCHRFFLRFGFVGSVVEGPALPSPVPGSWVRGWMAFRPRSAMSRLTPCLTANSSGRGEPPTASPATLRRRGFRKIRSIRSTSYSPASCVAAGVVARRRLPLGSSSTLQIGHAQCPVSGGRSLIPRRCPGFGLRFSNKLVLLARPPGHHDDTGLPGAGAGREGFGAVGALDRVPGSLIIPGWSQRAA
jgi:hypothetical protein